MGVLQHPNTPPEERGRGVGATGVQTRAEGPYIVGGRGGCSPPLPPKEGLTGLQSLVRTLVTCVVVGRSPTIQQSTNKLRPKNEA